jgi:hypothetical protein
MLPSTCAAAAGHVIVGFSLSTTTKVCVAEDVAPPSKNAPAMKSMAYDPTFDSSTVVSGVCEMTGDARHATEEDIELIPETSVSTVGPAW